MRKILFGVCLATSVAVHAQNIYGVEFNGNLWKITLPNGNGNLIGNTGVSNVNGATYRFGKLFVNRNNELYAVNEVTASSVLALTMNFNGNTDVRAIAFDLDNTLFAVLNNATSDQLWKVNLTTGQGTMVGNIGDTGIQGMEFTEHGILLAWSVTPGPAGGLYRIDPNTGISTDVNSVTDTPQSIQSLGFVGSIPFGVRDAVFRINSDGTATETGNGAYTDVRGMSALDEYVAPTAANIKLGRHAGGEIPSLVRADDNALRVCKFIVPNQVVPPVNIEFETTVEDYEPTFMSLFVRAKMAHAGSFSMVLDMFNFVTGRFDSPSESQITTVYNNTGVGPTSPVSQYRDADDRMRARILIKQTGPAATANWCVDIDKVSWFLRR